MTPFGEYIDEFHAGDRARVADELGYSKQYVHMLARGDATPKLGVAGLIEKWSKGAVTMQSWLPYTTEFKREARVRGEGRRAR